MSRIITKKILPEYFELIASGKQKYEFRVADFEAEEGDVLLLEEWDDIDPLNRKPTGRVIEKRITYVRKFNTEEFNTFEEIKQYGYYIMQLD